MSASAVPLPYPVFSDLDGSPLSGGYLYFGTAGLNPETNPVSVYIDAAMTTPIAQPVRTVNGYPAYNGSPTNLFINSDFSITVRNTYKLFVYNKPYNTTLTSAQFVSADDGSSGSKYTTIQGFINYLLSSVGSAIVGFIQAGAGAIARAVQDKLRERVSVEDFGAVGDATGVAGIGTDDTAAIQACWDYARDNRKKVVCESGKKYRITSTLTTQYNGTYAATNIDMYDSEIIVDFTGSPGLTVIGGSYYQNVAVRLRAATGKDSSTGLDTTSHDLALPTSTPVSVVPVWQLFSA